MIRPFPGASAAKARGARSERGFTLLEIMMVLTIIALLVGAAVPMVSGFSREQRLRDVMRELLIFAKTARTEAMTTGRASEIVFGAKGFALRRPGEEEPTDVTAIPRGMKLALQPLGDDKPLKPAGQRWVFQPTGLCEPITVIITEGDAYLEVDFDPLTAGIREERYNFP